MATIYRFLIEQKTSASGSGRKDTSPSNGGAKKGAAKKGKNVSIFGGERGGVEHNRYMRAINPLANKATYGVYEKGVRAARATFGVMKNISEKGAKGIFSGPALVILAQLVLLGINKLHEVERNKADKLNQQNYKQLENGIGAIHGYFEVSTNIITGRHTYNQNK